MKGRVHWYETEEIAIPLLFGLAAANTLEQEFGDFDGIIEKATENGKQIHNLLFIIEALNKNAVARLNVFHSNEPIHKKATVSNGKYAPLSSEQLAVILDFKEIGDLYEMVGNTIYKGNETEIETKEKNQVAQEEGEVQIV